MLPRQVGAHHLASHIGRGKIDVHSLPAVLPLRVSKEAIHDFRIKITLALEIFVKAAMRQLCTRHDLGDRDVFESVAVEQSAGTVNDLLLHFAAMTWRIRHRVSPDCKFASGPELRALAGNNIILNIFWCAVSINTQLNSVDFLTWKTWRIHGRRVQSLTKQSKFQPATMDRWIGAHGWRTYVHASKLLGRHG